MDRSESATFPDVLYVTEYMHPDHAWGHTRAWHEKQYGLVLAEVLELLHSRPNFRFYIDNYNEELLPFVRQFPHLLPELRNRLGDSSISAAICGYSNPRPVDVSEELLVRNLLIGRQAILRLFPGTNLSVCAIHDVPPGPSQIPQILRKCGFSYLAFSRPVAAMTAKGVAPEFLWQGIDGTAILCSCRNYSNLYSTKEFPHDYATNWPAAREWLTKQFQGAAGPSGIAWIHRGCDDSRPLRAWWAEGEPELDVLGLFAMWNATSLPPIQFVSPLEYFQTLERRQGALPTWKGVLDPVGWSYWHGHMGQHSLFAFHARITEKLTTLEKLAGLRSALGGATYPQAVLDTHWTDLLRTVGHAQLWLYADDFAKLHASVRSLERQLDTELIAAVEQLGNRAGWAANEAAQPDPCETQITRLITVFNAQCWPVQQVHEFQVEWPEHSGVRAVRVVDPAAKPIPAQVVAAEYHDSGTLKKCTIAAQIKVPALGIGQWIVDPQPAMPDISDNGAVTPCQVLEQEPIPAVIDIDGFRVHFADGEVAQITTPEGQVVYTPAPGGVLVWQPLNDTGPFHYGPFGERTTMTQKRVRLLEKGPVRMRAAVSGRLGSHMVQHIYTFSPHSSIISVETSIFCAGGNGEVRLVFPRAASTSLHAGAFYGYEPREPEQEPFVGIERMRQGSFYAHRWLGVTALVSGFAVVCPPGSHGWLAFPDTVEHILLKPIDLQGGEVQCSGLRTGTGRHTFSWALIPQVGTPDLLEFHHQALTLHSPLPTAVSWCPPTLASTGNAPTGQWSGLSVTPASVVIPAFYSDNDGLLIRMYQCADSTATCTLTLGFPTRQVTEVDCTGKPIQAPRPITPIDAKGDELGDGSGRHYRFHIAPWEIVTLRLGCKSVG